MEEGGTKSKRKISNITAVFMIGMALIVDGLQFVLTLTVIGAPLSWLLTFFSLCVFGVWNAVLGVNYFSGRKSGLKILSVITASVAELVPFVSAIPGVTAGIIGVIVGTRLEERTEKKVAAKTPSRSVRFGPRKIAPQPVDDNSG